MPAEDAYRLLAKEVAKLRSDVDALMRATQLSHASIEAGALRVYDESGTLRLQIGRQPDGTYTVAEFPAS